MDEHFKKLKQLYNREIRFHLHTVSLSDYMRKKQIPTCLRVKKLYPTIGSDNPAFCDKWCQILNKCSFDLMALVIQHATEVVNMAKDDIKKVRSELDTQYAGTDNQTLVDLDQRLTKYKNDLEKEIISRKLRKFQRDAEDYQLDRVYPWRDGNTQARSTEHKQRDVRGNPRHTSQPSASSATSLDTDLDLDHDDIDLDSTSSSSSFLKQRRGRGGRSRRQHRGGRNAAGGRKDQEAKAYHFRDRNPSHTKK